MRVRICVYLPVPPQATFFPKLINHSNPFITPSTLFTRLRLMKIRSSNLYLNSFLENENYWLQISTTFAPPNLNNLHIHMHSDIPVAHIETYKQSVFQSLKLVKVLQWLKLGAFILYTPKLHIIRTRLLNPVWTNSDCCNVEILQSPSVINWAPL